MSIFDFYEKSVNELYIYKTTCPICNVIEVFYINEKIIENECNHCSSTYQVTDEEIVRVMDRSIYEKSWTDDPKELVNIDYIAHEYVYDEIILI